MGQNKFFENRKYIAINLILFAVLYLSVSFNKEFIRPIYGHAPIIGILTGSFSNFMAAYIISLFPFAPVLVRKLKIKKARLIIYVFSIFVFIVLTIEEVSSIWGASTQYDLFDILASALGSILAILTFELLIRRSKNLRIDS